MNATANLLSRYEQAYNNNYVDIDEEGGVIVATEANDPTLADDLVASLPAIVLAAGHGVILGALGKLAY